MSAWKFLAYKCIILEIQKSKFKTKIDMKTHRNSNTEIPEQKEPTSETHDRSDLKQPVFGVSTSKGLSLSRTL